jgi:hypothetical protein
MNRRRDGLFAPSCVTVMITPPALMVPTRAVGELEASIEIFRVALPILGA